MALKGLTEACNMKMNLPSPGSNNRALLLKHLLQPLAFLSLLLVASIKRVQCHTFAVKDINYNLQSPVINPPLVILFSVSDVTCALFCKKRACVTFYSEDGDCVLGGLGEANNPSHLIYEELDPIVPLQKSALLAISSSEESPTYSPMMSLDPAMYTWFASETGELDSWWRVDLGSIFYIHKIALLPQNRNSIDPKYFEEIEIRVGETDISSGDFSSWHLFAYYQGPYTIPEGYLQFTSNDGVLGRYISVQRFVDSTEGALKIIDAAVFVRRKGV